MVRASGGREESVGRPRFSQKSRQLAHLLFHLVSQSNGSVCLNFPFLRNSLGSGEINMISVNVM